jgi:hypothetical protein
MVVGAAQIEGPLLAELERLAREPEAIAEINRELGRRAAALGLVKPSYARVRQLVHDLRAAAASSGDDDPSWGRLLLEVDLRHRSPLAIIDKLDGVPVRQDGVMSRGPHRRSA